MRSYYEEVDLIRWSETNTLLIYLFDLLLQHELIDQKTYFRQQACISEHFSDKEGRPLDNKRLNKSRHQMGTPQRAEKVESLIEAVVSTS